ncbi:MAG: TonB-dependent receptor [Blastochloris sp.]|nr:TonB-dependent receptor [Blastochloris sp.]
MITDLKDAHQKALKINLDPNRYGTFAEIGAGQETARWFFRVGGAAGTIAKSMSAYDMTFSDAIYGPCPRYVSKQRLVTMLDHEYKLLVERLSSKRGDSTSFFVFANSVSAASYRGNKECHGWLGVRFQRMPRSEPSEIYIHIRMHDRHNLQQQEALGIVGVNLAYGAFYYNENPDLLIQSLLDGLSTERIEIDLIRFSGEDFAHLDNRLINLQLVKNGMTGAVIFAPNGEVLQASDHIYKKDVLVERGNFRPVTKVNLDMLAAARSQFLIGHPEDSDNVVEIMEITLRNLLNSGDVDGEDFLARVDILAALGKTVMISNYAEFHRLAAYLSRNTKERIGIVLGIALLQEIFNEKYYRDLEGGILESFGRLFKNDLKLYIYPALSEVDGSTITAENLQVAGNVRHLYAHLYENECILPIETTESKSVTFSSREVANRIENGDCSWEELVVPEVAALIKKNKFFGYSRCAKTQIV